MASSYHNGQYSLEYGSSFPVTGLSCPCVSPCCLRANIFLNVQICSHHASSLNFPKTTHCLHNKVPTLVWQSSLARPPYFLYSNHIKATRLLIICLSLLTSLPVHGRYSLLLGSLTFLLNTSLKTQLKNNLFVSLSWSPHPEVPRTNFHHCTVDR